MVARTTISDGYRARAHAMVALARSWRPAEVLPGARTWVEAQAAGQEALSGLQRAPGHRAPTRRRRRRPGAAHAAGADRAGAGRASAAAGRGRGRPRRRPGRHRHPGPPSPGPRPGRGRAGGGGRGPLAQAPPAPSRLAGRTPLDRGPVAAAASASRSGGAGRAGAPAMTEPRLRAIVSALVGAIAALAFLVSFRAISRVRRPDRRLPRPPGVGGAAAGRQLHPGRLHRGPALGPGRPAGRLPLVPGRRRHPRLGRPQRRPRPRPSGRPGGRRHPPGGAAVGPGAADARRPPLPGASTRWTAGPEPDTARERLRAWLTVNPSTPLTAREAAELLGVSRSRAGVLLQQERAGLNGEAEASSHDRPPGPQPGWRSPHARGADRPRLRRRAREP